MKLLKCDACKIWLPVLILLVAGFYVAWLFVPPAAPGTLTIATGSQSGAYYQFAQQYQTGLQAEGVDLKIQPTAGSAEALALLQENKVDLAFVQGGIVGNRAENTGLQAIGSLFYEPLWVFLPEKTTGLVQSLQDLQGRKIAVGDQGSGTRELALTLLADNGVTLDNTTLLNTGQFEAIGRLFERGHLDAAFFVSAPQSAAIKTLAANPNLRIMDFRRYARAYSGHYPFLANITLGEGMIDLQQGVPEQERVLLAPAATLLASNNIHADHVRLLARETLRIHGQAGLLQDSGQFPSVRHLEVPPHPDAKQYFEQGPPFLEKYLPFAIATKLDQFKIMLIPLLTLLLPLAKGVFPLYQWRIRSRTYRWYKDLNAVDRELDSFDLAKTEQEIVHLQKLHGELAREVSLPLSYMSEFYALRMHTDHICKRLEERKAQLNGTIPTDIRVDEKLECNVSTVPVTKSESVPAAAVTETKNHRNREQLRQSGTAATAPEKIESTGLLSRANLPSDTEAEPISEQASGIVKKYTASAMTLSMIPVPLLDIAALTGLQLNMVHHLCNHYGVSFDKKRAKALLLATVSGVVPTMVVSSVSKVIPGVGTWVGSAGLSVSAGAIVYATGSIFIRHFENGGTLQDMENKQQELRQAIQT